MRDPERRLELITFIVLAGFAVACLMAYAAISHLFGWLVT